MKEPFRFKQFEIRHERSAMKVGTDAVLLGAWADVEHAGHILDIGAGSGVITLMMAQKSPKARVVGIEIEPKAASEATENAAHSPWSDRITVVEVDLMGFKYQYPFDAIVSNPPFFSAGNPSPNPQRADARHSQRLTMKMLLENVDRLLGPEGSFYVIIPHQEQDEFISIGEMNHLLPCKCLNVFPHNKKPAHRVLLKMRRDSNKFVRESLFLHEPGERGYSKELLHLTKDFYLYANSKR